MFHQRTANRQRLGKRRRSIRTLKPIFVNPTVVPSRTNPPPLPQGIQGLPGRVNTTPPGNGSYGYAYGFPIIGPVQAVDLGVPAGAIGDIGRVTRDRKADTFPSSPGYYTSIPYGPSDDYLVDLFPSDSGMSGLETDPTTVQVSADDPAGDGSAGGAASGAGQGVGSAGGGQGGGSGSVAANGGSPGGGSGNVAGNGGTPDGGSSSGPGNSGAPGGGSSGSGNGGVQGGGSGNVAANGGAPGGGSSSGPGNGGAPGGGSSSSPGNSGAPGGGSSGSGNGGVSDGASGSGLADGGADSGNLETEPIPDLLPATAVPQRTRFFRVANASKEEVTLYVQYYTEDANHQWKWFPATSADHGYTVPASAPLSVGLGPGEVADLSDNGWPINGSRVRVWGRSASGKQWNEFKDRDLVLVPETDENGENVYFASAKETLSFTLVAMR